MRIVILGGSSYVGRHIAEAVIGAGHDVIFANRGVTNPTLFATHRHVVLDRFGDASALTDLDVDLAIDTCGYAPDSVAKSAAALASRVKKYVFISSVDVYDLSVPDVGERSVLKTLDPGVSTAEFVPEWYGAQKARCEAILVEALGSERVLDVRAGFMVGPYDRTDRFTYWPVRLARGGDVLAPVGREMPVSLIDVRDVAAWIVSAIERDFSGAYNTMAAPGASTFGDVIDACGAIAPSDARIHWASPEFLVAHDVGAWVELPLWMPRDPKLAGFYSARSDRAFATGLRQRPLPETVRDILEEFATRPASQPLRAGLTPEREAALLAELRAARA